MTISTLHLAPDVQCDELKLPACLVQLVKAEALEVGGKLIGRSAWVLPVLDAIVRGKRPRG